MTRCAPRGEGLLHRVASRCPVAETRMAAYEAARRSGAPAPAWRWPIALAGTLLGIHAGAGRPRLPGATSRTTVVRAAARTTAVTLERPPLRAGPESPPPPPPPRPPDPCGLGASGGEGGTGGDGTPRSDRAGGSHQLRMPVGKSESYAGGLTAATGTSPVAVNDPRARRMGWSAGLRAEAWLVRPPRPGATGPVPGRTRSNPVRSPRHPGHDPCQGHATGRAEQVEVLKQPEGLASRRLPVPVPGERRSDRHATMPGRKWPDSPRRSQSTSSDDAPSCCWPSFSPAVSSVAQAWSPLAAGDSPGHLPARGDARCGRWSPRSR